MQNLTVGGVTYQYPTTSDEAWGDQASGWALAVTNSMLQKAGGLFTLLADVDLGANFGIASTYYKTRNANLASVGQFRLGNAEVIAWRNAANSADLQLLVNSSNLLTFGGNQLLAAGGALTASRALVTDGSSNISTSTMPSAYLDATSSIQTQLNAKLAGPLSGDVVTSGSAATIQPNVVANTKLAQMVANTLKGNNTGSLANAADLTVTQTKTLLNTAPTLQKFLSGSGTYTTPAGVLYLKVTMVGGGAGGFGSGTAAGTSPTAGGNTTFGTTLLAANGGGIGAWGNSATVAVGGTASLGTGPIGIALTGSGGTGGVSNAGASTAPAGSPGGSSALGGAGYGGPATAAGGAAATNSGSGGGSGGVGGGGSTGAGGASGGFVSAIITSPAATYAYAVGAGGNAGAAGTSGQAGGAGAAGQIVVEEFYQ